jgi:acetyl-CoA C-acetyltransferase
MVRRPATRSYVRRMPPANSPSTYVAGIFEHPIRRAVDQTVAELHTDVAHGALADAGLSLSDVDGYFCGADAPGLGGATMAEHIGLDRLRHVDTTESGGSSYLLHVRHALITMADTPLARGGGLGLSGVNASAIPSQAYTAGLPRAPMYAYGMAARRHMHEFRTTPEQLAWVKVAASHHAQHNPLAKLRDVVSVDDVLDSPMVADPLHRLDCCVVTDGGGALVLVREEIARELARPKVRLAGSGEAIKHPHGGTGDLLTSAGAISGPAAFEEAGISPADIGYASLYDSFTITVIIQLEDLGFCEKGKGGAFVADGNLISGRGTLPFNTDGGGLCNNHPGNKGGMPKLLEAVRQCRGEAHPAVQVDDREFVLAHATGGMIASSHVSATTIFKAE